MKIFIMLIFVLLFSSLSYAFLGFGDKKITTNNYIVSGPYLKNKGNQIFNGNLTLFGDLTVFGNTTLQNTTVTNYDIIENMNVYGEAYFYDTANFDDWDAEDGITNLMSWDGSKIDVGQDLDLGANNLYATNLGVTGIIATGTISATNLFGTTLAGTTLNSNIYRSNDGSNILFYWDGSEIDVGQNLNLADDTKLYLGDADDVSHYFDGSNYQIKAEVGSPYMNFTNFGNYSFDNNILLENGEYIDNSVDGQIRFYGGGAVNNNYIKFKLDGTYFPTLTAHKASDDSAQAFRFGSTVSFADDYAFEFGAVDAQFVWDTAQTNDAFILHLKSGTAGESGNFIIAHKDQWNYNFGLSSYTDPHLWLSAKGNSQTDLLGLHHNGIDGIIETISGDLILNPAGNVNVLGNLNVTGDITGNQIRGLMSNHTDTGVSFTFTDADVWYNFTYLTCVKNNGFTCDGENLTAQISGWYRVEGQATGKGSANHLFHLGVLVNGIFEEDYITEGHMRMTNANDIVEMTSSGEVYLEAGDVLKLAIRDSTAGGSGIAYTGQLKAIRVGT